MSAMSGGVSAPEETLRGRFQAAARFWDNNSYKPFEMYILMNICCVSVAFESVGYCFARCGYLSGSAISDRNSELPTESGTSNFALGLPQLLETDGYDSETKFRFRSVLRSSDPILPIRSDSRNEQKNTPPIRKLHRRSICSLRYTSRKVCSCYCPKTWLRLGSGPGGFLRGR